MLCFFSLLVLLVPQLILSSGTGPDGVHEKFLGGLASILQIERETVTITEQATETLSLESIVRTTETTVDYRTRTINSVVTTTNTIWETVSTEITKYTTAFETELTTRTDEIILKVSNTFTETLRVRLNLHLQTQMLPAQTVVITTQTTQTLMSTHSDIRTFYENLTSLRYSTLTRHSIHRFTEYETRNEIYTSTIKESMRKPRIKTVTMTTMIGSTMTHTATKTLYNQQHQYGRIPGNRAR